LSYTRYNYTHSQKTCHQTFLQNVCQMWTDFCNSFSGTVCGKFVITLFAPVSSDTSLISSILPLIHAPGLRSGPTRWSTGWLNARLYFRPGWTFFDDMICHIGRHLYITAGSHHAGRAYFVLMAALACASFSTSTASASAAAVVVVFK